MSESEEPIKFKSRKKELVLERVESMSESEEPIKFKSRKKELVLEGVESMSESEEPIKFKSRKKELVLEGVESMSESEEPIKFKSRKKELVLERVESMSESEEPIKFKSRKKNLRKRKESSDEEDNEEEMKSLKKLEEMKSIQKLRQRPNGVSIASLIVGEKVREGEELMVKDPFKVKTGGLVNMSSLKSGQVQQVDDAYDTGIGTQFSAETNKRDEDEEMMKYIEEQLSKRKKGEGESSGAANEESTGGVQYCSPEEAALQAVPDHLRQTTTVTSEEMLSNQMLSGIPEVDLGIEAKIRNIEATEEAKLKLLWDRHNKKDGPSQFVPTNMAVNFVQHNRFNIEDTGPPKKKERFEPPPPPKVPQDSGRASNNSTHEKKRDSTEKATDDYHYERFKKQFRRY